MNKKGVLIIVSGFSGAGKGTLVKELLRRYKEYALSISVTTRKAREGELDGREYFFVSREEFEKMVEEDQLIEYARYVENAYGTPKKYVEEQLESGKDVILEIEIQGAIQIKKKFPQALLLFVTPPNAAELKNRLVGRGTENLKEIYSRLLRATEEAKGINQYDYLIVNDDLNQCVEEMHSIIQNEHNRATRNLEFINAIREELNHISEGDK